MIDKKEIDKVIHTDVNGLNENTEGIIIFPTSSGRTAKYLSQIVNEFELKGKEN